MIELSRVEKRLGASFALAPTSLYVDRGETVAVCGESGSGKSTLLRLVVGLLRPDAGEVRVDGRPLQDDVQGIRQRKLGYVIQDGGLFPHLAARDDATLLARHLRLDERAVAARLDELCVLLRLDPALLDRRPGRLSGGQRQRVALMRALLLDPPILLLDEPLGALDPITRADLQDELRELFRRLGKTVLLVTHSLPEAAYLAERIVLMKDGRVVQDGRYEELVRSPAEDYVARFVAAERRLPAPAGAPS